MKHWDFASSHHRVYLCAQKKTAMHLKFFKQHDTMGCGIACLQMICSNYGRNLTQDFLSTLCHATSEGVSLLSIEDAANSLGFTSACVRSTISEISVAPLPCILHWNQNHFVVLYKVKNGERFYVADPGKGMVTYDIDEFKSHWLETFSENKEKGVAMFLEPTSLFYELNDEYDKKTDRSFRFLFGYIQQYKKYFCQIILGLLVGSLLQLSLPFLTQNIVDVGIKNKDVDFIWLILIGQLAITFSQTFIEFIRRWLLLHISMRINISLISDFIIKLLQLPMSFFDTKLMGDLMQRIGDHTRVNTFLTQKTLTVAFSIVSIFVFGFVLLLYNRIIFAIFLVGSTLYGLWMTLFLYRRKIIDYELFEQQAINNNKTYQFITSMQEIKLQDCEQRRRWEWEDVQANLFQVQIKSMKVQQIQEAGSVFINEFKNIIITIVSATAVINGSLTLGMMLAIQYIVGQLNSPIEQFMNFIYSLQDVKISLERINEIHKKGNEEDFRRIRTEFDNNNRSIEFNNVDFKYDPHSLSKTIDNLCIHIPEGKITAIVGASGSGKTTLIKLMLGYYPTEKGQIVIAGHDIAEYNLKWWRRQCGVVMQDGVIFSESIARNIAVDDNEIDMDRLEIASVIANIKDYVMGLPLKYNTNVGRDAMGLSQGQKQRILIARAVYKNPDYFFLDEATNSLDANNERVIVKNLNSFYKGKTVVVVAHRLSTVKNADQIIVLDKGRVVEVGNHETLIAKRGFYYNLVKNQLELGN